MTFGLISVKLLAKTTTSIIYDSLGVESEFMKIAISHPNFPKLLKPLAYSFSFLYEKVVCRLANVIINVSNIDRHDLIRKYKIKKSKTFLIQIPSTIQKINPINFEDIKSNSRTKLGLPKDKVIIIFHGGLPHPPNQEAINLIEKLGLAGKAIDDSLNSAYEKMAADLLAECLAKREKELGEFLSNEKRFELMAKCTGCGMCVTSCPVCFCRTCNLRDQVKAKTMDTKNI